MTSIITLPIRTTARLMGARSIFFFEKHGSETFPSKDVVKLAEKDLAAFKEANPDLPWGIELGGLSNFAKGGRLFAVKRNGTYVSFGWARRSDRFPVGELGGVAYLRAPRLCIWDCFTQPEHRGRGYYPTLLVGIRHLMDEQSTLIYCLRENVASRRGILKAGFENAFRLIGHRFFAICTKDVRKIYSGYGPGSVTALD